MSTLFEDVTRRFEDGHAAPPPRLSADPRVTRTEELIPAAVLVAITERERPGMLLLHRPSTMRAHPGQVALPGGRIDPGESPVEAALREANEELGIDPDDVRVIGASDIYRTGSGYEITPVIGIIPPDVEIRPNPAEVAQWFEVPVDFVLDPANHGERTVHHKGRDYPVIEILWNDGQQDHAIWGVTGAILRNLAARLNWLESPRSHD